MFLVLEKHAKRADKYSPVCSFAFESILYYKKPYSALMGADCST